MTRHLVVAPNWVGDLVMAQPLIARLAARADTAAIDVLGAAWVLPLATRMPGVNDALVNPTGHGELGLGKAWRLGRTLRARRYDAAWVLPNAWKQALAPWFAGIPRRVGYVGEFRHGLLNDARVLDAAGVPRLVDRFAALADVPGAAVDPARTPLPRLRVDTASMQAACERLRLDPAPLARRVVALCPGAEYGPAKRWPVAHFATLARTLHVEDGCDVWLFGSAKDRDVCADIARDAAVPVRDLAGRTSLAEACDLLSAAAVVVSNDSGLMHVAAALDRPVVALFGSSSPHYTPPLGARAEVLRHAVPCQPCFRRECPLGHLDCLVKLEPSRVIARTRAALADTIDRSVAAPAASLPPPLPE